MPVDWSAERHRGGADGSAEMPNCPHQPAVPRMCCSVLSRVVRELDELMLLSREVNTVNFPRYASGRRAWRGDSTGQRSTADAHATRARRHPAVCTS
eukprot:1338330-Prymnesium_polylepis.1